jgi:DNA polymerase III delta prime subunit
MQLLRLSGGRQLLPTTVWATLGGPSVNDAKFSLERPSVPSFAVNDIKDWLATNPDKELLGGSKETGYKKIRSHAAATALLREAVSTSGANFSDKKVWILLPSFVGDTHKQYKKKISEVVAAALAPNTISYLFEPEMVLEYFRLCRKELVYPKDRTPIYLIVDCGALTCNVTLVMGTRAGHVGVGTLGRHRSALHPVGGDSVTRAGRWIDERLSQKLPNDLGDPSEALLVAEHAKIALSLSSAPVTVVHTTTGLVVHLAPSDLESAIDELIDACVPAIKDVLARGYEQLSGSEVYAKALHDLGITDVGSFPAALTAIVFSGGTTLLPGFRDKIAARLQVTAPILYVGDDYAQAAAIGAMSHILDSENVRASTDGTVEEPPIAFLPSLHDDIQIEGKSEKQRRKQKRVVSPITILTRKEWSHLMMSRFEASRPVPEIWRGDKLDLDLVWAGETGRSRRLSPHPRKNITGLDVGHNVDAVFKIDIKDSRLTVQSIGCKEQAVLYAELDTHATLATEGLKTGKSSAIITNDIVLDFGMSKLAFVVPDAAGMSVEKKPAQWVRRPLGPDWRIEMGGGGSSRALADAGLGHVVVTDSPLPALAPTLPPSIVAAPVLTPLVQTPILHEVVLLNASTFVPQVQSGASLLPDSFVPKATRPPGAPSQAVKAPPVFRSDADSEVMFLEECFKAAEEANLDIARGDLVAMHLAAKTRPFIMLAGSPGIGKTSLALFYASMLGCRKSNGNLEVVHVQPDWVTDAQLVDHEAAPLRRLLHGLEHDVRLLHGIVLDEMNLSRPDYYLMRLLATLDKTGPSADAHTPFASAADASLLVFGTLNVDEASRPPSDKVLDRGFLLEPARPVFSSEPWHLAPRRLRENPCVSSEVWRAWANLEGSLTLPRVLRELVELTHINPSRRAVRDVAVFLAHGSKLGRDEWATQDDLLDRAVFGRFLPRLRGDQRTLSTIVDKLVEFAERHHWPRTSARVKLMSHALNDGYATFWCE